MYSLASSNGKISAGTLRELGLLIPPNIPDCAYIDKESMIVNTRKTDINDAESFTSHLEITFTQPFRWIDMQYLLRPY